MADAPWHVFGTDRCPHCGVDVPVAQLLCGGHRCDPDERQAREAEQLQVRLEILLFEVGEFLRSPEGRSRLAFARWCRAHGR